MYDASDVMISNFASCNFFWCVLNVPENKEHNKSVTQLMSDQQKYVQCTLQSTF
jgi:hypothetical protein